MTSEPVAHPGDLHLRSAPKLRPHFARRLLVVTVLLGALAACAYFAAVKWGVRHETFFFYDAARQRTVALEIAVRRDAEMRAEAGLRTMPVAVVSHGNTVRFTEYSFLTNVLAARGYLAISIQHDLASDAPLMTKAGEPYVGREPVYERGVANILFALAQVKKLEPNADYTHLTLVGHSNGGDISMYFAKLHPDMVSKIVTLDNLRVPLQGAFKILSFRSHDSNFKPDAGVVPSEEVCKKNGITVVNTEFQHNDMSDRGPDSAKVSIEQTLEKFLGDDSDLGPVNTDRIDVAPAGPDAKAAVPN